MNMKDKLTIFVMTHIVNYDTEPYMNNEMILECINSTQNNFNIKDVNFKIYCDSKFKDKDIKLYSKYLNNLRKIFKDMDNVTIEEDTGFGAIGNFKKFIKSINTPYFMFLEHDWEFTHKIDMEEIITAFEDIEYMNYCRFPKADASIPGEIPTRGWDALNGGVYEVYEEYNKIPLWKISFISGNPHIARTSFFKDQIEPHLVASGQQYEKQIFHNIIIPTINELGKNKSHEITGTFALGHLMAKHIGGWCRKG